MCNQRAFCPKHQTTPKTPVQPSTSGADQTITPVMNAIASTSSSPTTSVPTTTTTSPGSTLYLINPNRGPPKSRHQAVMPQGAKFKAN